MTRNSTDEIQRWRRYRPDSAAGRTSRKQSHAIRLNIQSQITAKGCTNVFDDKKRKRQRLDKLIESWSIDTRSGSGFIIPRLDGRRAAKLAELCPDATSRRQQITKLVEMIFAKEIDFHPVKHNPYDPPTGPKVIIPRLEVKVRNFILNLIIPTVKLQYWNRKKESWRRIVL